MHGQLDLVDDIGVTVFYSRFNLLHSENITTLGLSMGDSITVF